MIGAGSLAVATARLLIQHGHEVVIIERDQAKVDRLSEEIDCSFVVGDGGRPAVLKEVGPKSTDFLFCLTESDHDNIIASLVGRSLGFGRVVTSIVDTDFEPICSELGLGDAIYIDRTISRSLSDMVEGIETAGLTAALRGGLRLCTFHITKDRAGPIGEIALPKETRIVAVTREGTSRVAEDDVELAAEDEILVLTDAQQIDKLREIFTPPEPAEEGEA